MIRGKKGTIYIDGTDLNCIEMEADNYESTGVADFMSCHQTALMSCL